MPAADRSAFLRDACAGDEALRQDVEALVSAADDAEGFLEPARVSIPEARTGAPGGLLAGRQLGRYRLVALIGAGGMGEVYRATDTRLGREVAAKILPDALSTNPDRLRRFEQEARAAAALNHPNLLAVFDVGTHEGTPYLVSELLVGGTLRDVLDRGPLPIRQTLDYAGQIATGLAAAHDKAIVHRDVKPENVFITRDGRMKILDFGLAKLAQKTGDGPDDATFAGSDTVFVQG